MRSSIEPKDRKYVEEFGFSSFAKRFGKKYGKKTDGYCNKNKNRCCKDCI